ncbi:hypothetical protein [Coxiella burnetii]|nr:hypothetical protein [Coxiella burnetii]
MPPPVKTRDWPIEHIFSLAAIPYQQRLKASNTIYGHVPITTTRERLLED